MKEEVIVGLKSAQALIICEAVDYLQASENEDDESKSAAYYHIYEGLLKAVTKIQERIEEIRKEGL